MRKKRSRKSQEYKVYIVLVIGFALLSPWSKFWLDLPELVSEEKLHSLVYYFVISLLGSLTGALLLLGGYNISKEIENDDN